MIHWREMDTASKIHAVKSVWEPGVSASQIAARFDGATRNAVIGLMHRYPGDFDGVRLRTRSDAAERLRVAKRRYILKNKLTKPIDVPEQKPNESHLCGRPLFDLGKDQCRWPVNDAGPGELHLFCGQPAERSYCEHHASRAFRAAELVKGDE